MQHKRVPTSDTTAEFAGKDILDHQDYDFLIFLELMEI